jgi:hypothetical protein
MSFLARCPSCGQKARAPEDALAASVPCPRCGKSYIAAPVQDGAARKASRYKTPLAAVAAAIVAVRTETDDVSAEAPASAIAIAPPPVARAAKPRRVPDWIHPGGLAACLLASGGLLAASLPWLSVAAMPLCALGLLVGAVAVYQAAHAKPQRRVLPIAGASASALILIVAWLTPQWLGPVFNASRQRVDFSPETIVAVPLRLGLEAESLEADGWTDASRAALQQDSVRVQVAAVSVGPVKFAAPKGMSKENYVAVSLAIQHLGHGQSVTYIHWGAPGMQETPQPTLMQAGRKLEHRVFESDVVAGQVRQGQTLYPGKGIGDVLLFDGSATPGEPLRLELPAAVWGGRGALKFAIPAAMVKQAPNKNK